MGVVAGFVRSIVIVNGTTASANVTVDENSDALFNITGMVANASVTVNATHADGQVDFNITAFDLAGNSLTVNQTNLISSNLTIDKNIPIVSNLSLYSNNSVPSLAKAGDLINITLEVSENIYNATLEILNTTINMTELNNTAHANISVLQNFPNGPVAFNITAYDAAGNEFNITQNDASANVIIDTANPESSNLTIYSNNPHNIYNATLEILNTTINMTELNNTAHANIAVLQNCPNGPVAFKITYDAAGNEFIIITRMILQS